MKILFTLKSDITLAGADTAGEDILVAVTRGHPAEDTKHAANRRERTEHARALSCLGKN